MERVPGLASSPRQPRLRQAFEYPVGRWFNGAVAVMAAITLIAFSPPGGYFFVIILGIWAWLLLGVIWLGRFIGVVGVRRLTGRRGWWRTWLVTPVIVVVSAVAIQLDAPFHPRFRLSEPAMTRFAKRALDEPTRTPPERIGLYKVGRVETFEGGVRFNVAGAGILDDEGFAYSPQGPPPSGGDNSYEHLRGPWYLWRWNF